MTTDQPGFPACTEPPLWDESDDGGPIPDLVEGIPSLAGAVHAELHAFMERLIEEFPGISEPEELEEIGPGLRRLARSIARRVEDHFGM